MKVLVSEYQCLCVSMWIKKDIYLGYLLYFERLDFLMLFAIINILKHNLIKRRMKLHLYNLYEQSFKCIYSDMKTTNIWLMR